MRYRRDTCDDDERTFFGIPGDQRTTGSAYDGNCFWNLSGREAGTVVRSSDANRRSCASADTARNVKEIPRQAQQVVIVVLLVGLIRQISFRRREEAETELGSLARLLITVTDILARAKEALQTPQTPPFYERAGWESIM